MKRAFVVSLVWAFLSFAILGLYAAVPNQPVTADDPLAAAANREALEAATGRLALPRGIVSVDLVPVQTGDNSGLVMSGNGLATIKSMRGLGSWIDRAAIAVCCGEDGKAALSWRGDETPANRPTIMPPGQVGWLFEPGSESWQYPRPNRRVLSGQPVPNLPTWEFMRAWRGVSFGTGKTEFVVPAGHGMVVGERIWATDGPSFNECVGEFATVVQATPQTITIAKPLIRTYTQGTFCRGPYPRRIVYNGIRFEGQLGSVIFMQSTELTLTDCHVPSVAVVSGSDVEMLHFLSCGKVEVRRCNIPAGIKLSAGCELTVLDSTISSVRAEQGQIATTFVRCRIGWLDALHQCVRWTLTDCEFEDWFGIYDEWVVSGCRCNGLVRVRGRACRVTNLKANGPVIVQGDYQGAPVGAGTGVVLDGIEAEYIELRTGTSGQIKNSTAPIVCYDPATRLRWTRDGKPLP